MPAERSLRDIERRVFAMASLYDHLLELSDQAESADLGRYLSAMVANFDEQPCRLSPPRGECLFSSRDGALAGERLGGRSTVVFLEPAS